LARCLEVKGTVVQWHRRGFRLYWHTHGRDGRERSMSPSNGNLAFAACDRSVPMGHRTDAERGFTRDKAGAVNSLYAFAVAKSALQRGPANRGVLSARG